jgi:hypothetical protein
MEAVLAKPAKPIVTRELSELSIERAVEAVEQHFCL